MQVDTFWSSLMRGTLSRSRVIGLAAGTGAGALMAACGRSGGSAGRSSGANSAAETPRPGGLLTGRQTTDPFDSDPTGKPTNNRSVMCQCYDSLLSFKATPDTPYNSAVLQPGLAEKWEAPD